MIYLNGAAYYAVATKENACTKSVFKLKLFCYHIMTLVSTDEIRLMQEEAKIALLFGEIVTTAFISVA